MKLKFLQIIFLISTFLIAEANSPYVDIANELLVRKKLSKKLPGVFNENKFLEIENKINSIANIDSKDSRSQLKVANAEYHWCYAQAYLLSSKDQMALKHYRLYKIQIKKSPSTINKVFKNDISELEISLNNSQSILAQDILLSITNFKKITGNPSKNSIISLQNKLNTFNELYDNIPRLIVDGNLGPKTKTAFFDFEENNPYFISQNIIADTNRISNSNRMRVSTQDRDPFSKSKNKVLSTKIVFSSEKIKSIPGTSIAEVLENVLGLNIKRQGSSDVLANISTYGGTGEQTLILVDGLKISNQQTISHDLDLPINIDDIQEIEIYRNASAREYGSGAVSGVVNIVTKSSKDRTTYLSTEAGDYALSNNNIMLAFPIGRSYHNFSFTSLKTGKSGSYATNTALDKNTFFYKYSLEEGKSSTNFSFGYLKKGNQISNHLKNIYPRQYERNTTKFFNSRMLWDFGTTKLESNTHWYDHRNELAYDVNVGGWDNYVNTEIGLNFNLDSESRRGYNKSSFSFNRELNSNSMINDNIRDHYSLTYQDFSISDKLNFDLGISANYYEDFGWFSAPGYQMSYNINNNANIYHKYDRGFRLPSFYEMYANDYMYNGNEMLKHETINSFEYGIQIYGTALRMTASQFYKNNQNVIDWFHENSIAWKSTNIPDVLTSGHNMHLELYPEIINKLTFIKTIEVGYSYLDIEHNGSKEEYKNISNYLKHQLVLGTTYSLPFNISRSWYVRYEQPVNQDNRIIFDTQIRYNFWRFETSLNINNLFNVQYEDVLDVALPGRWMRFSLRYNL